MAGIQKRWGLMIGGLIMAGCLVVACEDGGNEGPNEAQAGAGQGGAPANEGPCNLGSIESNCAGKDCPDSPADVSIVCSAFGTTRYQTECGSMINVTQGLGSTSYYFDEDDKLIGITSTNDLYRDCGDGHESISTVAGTTCKIVGEGEDLCDTEASCHQESACDSFLSECPADLASFEPTCGDGSFTQQFRNACGGTTIEFGDYVLVHRFTFDEDGALIGTSWSGDVGDGDCWGNPCAPRGTPQDLCLGVGGGGGAGGADAGGQGGANAGGGDTGGAGGSP